jgi:hypothetical protein
VSILRRATYTDNTLRCFCDGSSNSTLPNGTENKDALVLRNS